MPTPVLWSTFAKRQANFPSDYEAGGQFEPRVVALAGGNILIIWTEDADGMVGDGAGKNIVGIVLYGFQAPFGAGIETFSTIDDEEDFDVAPTADGGFVLVYVDDDISSPNQTGIIWDRFDAAANRVDSALIATENVLNDSLANPQVAVNLQTGQSMITFTRATGLDPDVRGVLVSAAGVVGAEFDAAQNSADFAGSGDVAILANGNYVSVYRENDSVTGAEARIFTSAGTLIANLTLSSAAVGMVKVATLANGNWVATWSETAVGNGDIKYAVYGPTGGAPVAGPLSAASGASIQKTPDIVALRDGGFVIVWDNDTNAVIEAQRFDAAGVPDGGVFEIENGGGSDPDAALTPDGRLFFTWIAPDDEIWSSIWDPRAGTLNVVDFANDARNFVNVEAYFEGTPGDETIDATGFSGDLEIDGREGNDILIGGSGFRRMEGGDGNDVLIGGTGEQFMFGGQGDDIYYVDFPTDIAGESTGTGTGNDRVLASASYTLGSSFQNEIELFTTIDNLATTAINLTGNPFGQRIEGNNGTNILRGEGGNDTLFGFGGADFLVGGTGTDIMVGGLGDDTYYVDETSDAISEFAGEGFDRLATNITLALAADADIERLDVEDLTSTNAIDLTGSGIANVTYGNDGVNILRGEAGNDELRGFGGSDFLVGGTGTDLMVGGAGNDTFYVDDALDAIGEIAGEGNDRIAASVSFVLSNGANVEVLEAVNLTATTAFDLTGSDSNNTITGNNGVNILRGEGGNDILSSAGGDDFLVGGSGNDNLTGGAGNDTYYVDSTGDAILEIAGEGSDRVVASVTYSLGLSDDIELLETATQSGTTAINLFGSNTANTIRGNDGANFLSGKGGSDTLTGFGGADKFQFTAALVASNVDTITDFVPGLDRIELENATFTGLSAGTLPAGAFRVDSAAQDADDRILYNSQTGQLFFDADGNGAVAAVQFATLSGAPALTAGDFTVI